MPSHTLSINYINGRQAALSETLADPPEASLRFYFTYYTKLRTDAPFTNFSRKSNSGLSSFSFLLGLYWIES